MKLSPAQRKVLEAMAEGNAFLVWQATVNRPERFTCAGIPRIHWGTHRKFLKAKYIERDGGNGAAYSYRITDTGREALKQ